MRPLIEALLFGAGPSPQVTNICITDGGKSLYFGPYNPEALNKHLPVDHLLFATVEAGESGVQVRLEPRALTLEGHVEQSATCAT